VIVFVTEEIITEKRVVDEALEHDVHEAGLAKVQQSSASCAKG
jgi:hypothetical protein